MNAIPVNAIYSGMQQDGHWSGTPSLIIQLMNHPSTSVGALDCSYPITEWDYDPAFEVSLTKLMGRRLGSKSAHYSMVGASTLAETARSFRERHVVIICREPGYWEVAPFVTLLRTAGRSIQVMATAMCEALTPPDVWVSLIDLPVKAPAEAPAMGPHWPSEVLASIRSRSDLDRAEAVYGHMGMVWLRPSPLAEEGIYRQCIAVATRHLGWRVTKAR